MNKSLKSLIVTAIAPLVVAGCSTCPHSQQWEYKVVAGYASAVGTVALNSPEKQQAFLNEQGKEGWIFVQQEGGWFYFKRAKQ